MTQPGIRPTDKRVLTRRADSCTNTTITVTKARIAKAPTGGSIGEGAAGPTHGSAACADAKAAGYGPYGEGRDPESDWYRDADADGTVCEWAPRATRPGPRWPRAQ